MSTFDKIRSSQEFTPENCREFITIDMHTGGEPLRVITGGLPEISAESVLAYRRKFRDHHDDIRKLLMHEPRGHRDMYGVYLVPPNDEGADFGVVFIHNEGYSTMCGHAVIALARLAVQAGWVEMTEPSTEVIIDAPCGRIFCSVEVNDGKLGTTTFEGVPSFVFKQGEVQIQKYGQVAYTLAYGGAFYAYVHAPDLGLNLSEPVSQLVDLGMQIKREVIKSSGEIEHPFEKDLSFLYGTIFTGGKPLGDGFDRNVCIFADGEVDRSPTGSGVSGRLAILHENGELKTGEMRKFESITGSVFTGEIKEIVEYDRFKAVIPKVSGTASITGVHRFLLETDDEFGSGFLLH